MRCWWVFKVVNYLGFSKKVKVWARSSGAAKRYLDKNSEYPVLKTECLGGYTYAIKRRTDKINDWLDTIPAV